MLQNNSPWPLNSKDIALELHSELKLDNKNWHHLKDKPERRAAELIAGAMVQLMSGGKPSDVVSLLNQSIKWINNEIKAPGCPHRQ